MDLGTFFEHFDTLAEAPNGIQRLRELILDMAVRGKLVPQDPEDEPAEKLISKNQQRILISRTGKRKTIPELSDSGSIFPLGWARCRLSDAALIEMGNSPPGSTYNQHGDGVPLINGPVEFTKGPFGLTVVNQYTTAPSRMCESGDLLVCVRGATTGRTNIAAFKACIGRGVASVRAWGAQQYINYLMWWFGEKLLQQGKGTTFPSISYVDLAGLEIFLPPLAEQNRIVAKVDELMGLCDALEAAQQNRNTLRQNLRASALDALMNASYDRTLETSWAFVRDNWRAMCDRPEDVEGLRQVVLQIAVQGKIVSQNTEDEPAEKLLQNIIQCKEKLIKDKALRKSKLMYEPLETSLFELPLSWKWARLDDICFVITDGEHATPPRVSHSPIPLGTAKNVRNGFLDFEKTDYVSPEVAEKCWKRCKPSHNDLLMVCVGATTGRLCLIKKPPEFVIVRSVALIRPFPDFVFPEYLELAIKSPLLQEQIWGSVKRSAQPCLYINRMQKLLIPLPPLAEQKRIVAKVDELMQLCDQLEESLRSQQQHAEALTASAISHLAA